VNEQDKRIANYFASLSLSDDSSSFTSQQLSGNRMWHGDEAPWKDDLDLQLPARGEQHADRPLTDAE
jgi:hypothetical protein